MQKRTLLCVGVAILLAFGLGVVTRGDEHGKDYLTELAEMQTLNRHLDAMTESLGAEAPAVFKLRERRTSMLRARIQKELKKPLGGHDIEQVLKTLGGKEVLDQQLRESLLLLTAEILTLQNRVDELEQGVSELERDTSPRIMTLK